MTQPNSTAAPPNPVVPEKFTTETQWGTWEENQNHGSVGLSSPGWALPSDPSRYIGKSDPYWVSTLANAQQKYGDPGIRYNTNDISQQRFLQFSDGTPLPKDGTVLYHNTAASQNFVRNADGSLSRQDFNGNPLGTGTFSPAGYRKAGDEYAPVDSSGNQVAPLMPASAVPSNIADRGNGIATPTSGNGDYYTVDPATGQVNYFDKNHQPISEQNYLANAPQAKPGDAQAPAASGDRTTNSIPAPPVSGSTTPMQSTPVTRPDGMIEPKYPAWATADDPDIPNQMTAVMVRLYNLFGSGTPAQSQLPDFPFNTATGDKSGIDSYDAVKKQFVQIETQFDDTAKAYRDAVTGSAYRTEAGRQAINTAIGTFNSNVASLPEGSWGSLLTAESTLLDQVKAEVVKASGQVGSIPSNPDPAPGAPPRLPSPPGSGDPSGMDPAPVPGPAAANPATPAGPTAPGAEQGKQPSVDDLIKALGQQPNPAASMMGNPLGMNPLGALGGMNPLGALGGMGGMNPLGGLGGLSGLGGSPSNPVAALPAAAKADPVKPIEAKTPEDTKVSPVQPVNTAPQNEPLSPAAPLAAEQQPAPAAAGHPDGGPHTPAAEQVAHPGADGKPTVTLPDGKVVDAADPRAAQAAQTALDGAGPGGDAAQKAYSQTGVDLPSDGKNPGAKVDPADMRPGDVLKWGDKTMVAVAPGLVADPSHPGVTHTLADVLKDPNGFQGVFRPTESDPTLSAHGSPPPLHDPAPPAPPSTAAAPHPAPQPPPAPAPVPTPAPAAPPSPEPGNTIPLSSPPTQAGSSGQPAQPSPFEQPTPPPATRSTKAERIAAGQE